MCNTSEAIPPPMSESCLVISPPARNEVMQRESGMGINSRGAVTDVGAVLDPDTPLRRKQSMNNASISVNKQMKAPRAVTETDARGSEVKGFQELPSSNRDNGIGESRFQKRKVETMEGVEHDGGEGKQGSSGANSENNSSLPQHKQIQSVEPLDISYCATPATLRLKDILMSRLDAAVLSGRIQVVSGNGACQSFRTCQGLTWVCFSLLCTRLISRGEV